MGLGIWDTSDGQAPGTVIMTDEVKNSESHTAHDLPSSALKFGKGKDQHIVLSPQPSDDPEDPLNWSAFRRRACISSLFAGVVMGGIWPGQVVIQEDLGLTLAESGQATSGYCALAFAISAVFFGPLMQIIGRRPIFLLAGVCLIIGHFVSASSSTFAQLVAGRVITGIGMSPYECLSGAIFADVYFVHRRGFAIAMWNIGAIATNYMGPAISGVIISRAGWRTSLWICGGLSCFALLAQILFQHETLYIRDTEAPSTNAVMAGTQEDSDLEKEMENSTPAKTQYATVNRSRFGNLAPWTKIYRTKSSFWAVMIRPLLLIPTPIFILAFLAYGIPISFILCINISSAYLFAQEPYFFGPEASGYIYFGPTIGALLGFIFSSWASDKLIQYMSRRNGGIYEPEFRLPLLVIFGLCTGFGYLGWGISANNRDPWIGPVVSFGIVGFGLAVGVSQSASYVIDAFGPTAMSALTALTTMKNFFLYGVTYWAAPWVLSSTILSLFGGIAGIHFGCMLAMIPLYVLGKRFRRFNSKYIHFEDEGKIAH